MAIICEDKSGLVAFKPLLTEAEVRAHGQRIVKVQGVFQNFIERNRNGRIYPRTIWESQFSRGSTFHSRLQRRNVLGMIEHPDDGRTDLKHVSHVITEARIATPEDIRNSNGAYVEGDVIGTYETLLTPEGQVLQALIESKVEFGISSRGDGDVEPSARGEIVKDNFVLETWDVVFMPSVVRAIPKLVESIAKAPKDAATDQGAIRKLVESTISSGRTFFFPPVSTPTVETEAAPEPESVVQEAKKKRPMVQASKVEAQVTILTRTSQGASVQFTAEGPHNTVYRFSLNKTSAGAKHAKISSKVILTGRISAKEDGEVTLTRAKVLPATLVEEEKFYGMSADEPFDALKAVPSRLNEQGEAEDCPAEQAQFYVVHAESAGQVTDTGIDFDTLAEAEESFTAAGLVGQDGKWAKPAEPVTEAEQGAENQPQTPDSSQPVMKTIATIRTEAVQLAQTPLKGLAPSDRSALFAASSTLKQEALAAAKENPHLAEDADKVISRLRKFEEDLDECCLNEEQLDVIQTEIDALATDKETYSRAEALYKAFTGCDLTLPDPPEDIETEGAPPPPAPADEDGPKFEALKKEHATLKEAHEKVVAEHDSLLTRFRRLRTESTSPAKVAEMRSLLKEAADKLDENEVQMESLKKDADNARSALQEATKRFSADAKRLTAAYLESAEPEFWKANGDELLKIESFTAFRKTVSDRLAERDKRAEASATLNESANKPAPAPTPAPETTPLTESHPILMIQRSMKG